MCACTVCVPVYLRVFVFVCVAVWLCVVVFVSLSDSRHMRRYTADEDCVPGGPHFDYTYYITYTTIVGAVSGLVGVAIFQVIVACR